MKENIVKMMIVQLARWTCDNWEGMWWIWLSSSWGGTVQQLRGDVMGLFCRYCIWWSLWQVTAWVCLHPEIDRTSSTLERRLWSVLQNTLCSSNQNVWCSLMLSEGIWKCFIRKLHVTWEPFDFVQSGQLEISFLEILLEDWKKICFVSQIVYGSKCMMIC